MPWLATEQSLFDACARGQHYCAHQLIIKRYIESPSLSGRNKDRQTITTNLSPVQFHPPYHKTIRGRQYLCTQKRLQKCFSLIRGDATEISLGLSGLISNASIMPKPGSKPTAIAILILKLQQTNQILSHVPPNLHRLFNPFCCSR